MTSVSRKIASGTIWTTASTIITVGVQILRLSILTRFVDPEVFGLIAILTLILGVCNTFADLGFSASIMHKRDIPYKDFSSLYWIQFAIYILLYLIIWLCAVPISNFYDQIELLSLIPVMTLDLVFYGIGKLYGIILLKEFQYRTLAIRNIICSVVSLAVAVILAYIGCGVYSLILSTLSQSFLLNVWNFGAGQRYLRIGFAFDLKSNYSLIKIGLYQTGSQILDYLSG